MSLDTSGTGKRLDRVLELIVVWVLAASGAGLVATLAGHFLAPQICLIATVLTALYAWRVTDVELVGMRAPKWGHVALLMLICLFFRLPAFNYVLGGQDEGLYVNMAHYIEQSRGIAASDEPLERLQGTTFVNQYLAENRHIRDYVSGVYINTPRGSGLSFQFYHLFPIWMALFDGVFGSTFAVYALTLFALLSVVFMYRLALVLTDSTVAALTAGLLLALNPLHAFFSKFPVTEVPTLAFSLVGFTYLALFWRSDSTSRRNSWLALSLASFGALFITRISGFMYVPFLVVIALAGAVADPDRPRQRLVHRWVIGVIALYGLSVVYGLHWSHQYAEDIYRLSFERIFPRHWRAGVAVIVITGLAVWLGIALACRTNAGLEKSLVPMARRAIGPILVVGLLAGIYRIYQLGWTTHFDSDPSLGGIWGLAGSSWRAVRASSLAALFVYLGPLLPLTFFWLALRRQADPPSEFLRLFAVGFFVYLAVLQWVVPYGPYYARYLLSEAVPYMLLFVVVLWARMPKSNMRRAMTTVLALTLVYCGAVTAAQIGKNESDDLYQSLAKLLSPVDRNDVVLLDVLDLGLPDNSEIKTPIVFTFGLPAITVSKANLLDSVYVAAINARYNDVFVLSPSAVVPQGFESTGSTRIKVWAYEWNHSYPHNLFLREDMNLYLYRLVKSIFPLGHAEEIKPSSAWTEWLASGWSVPESLGVWSSGNHAELEIDPQAFSKAKQGIRLTMNVSGLVNIAHPQQRVVVSLDGSLPVTTVIKFPETHAQIDVNLTAAALTSTQKIQIALELPDAVTPKSLGINEDRRVLAVRLEALTAAPLDEVGKPALDRGKSSAARAR